MVNIYEEEYMNSLCKFKIGDIVRYKDDFFDSYCGEMRVVDISVELYKPREKGRTPFMYNFINLVPKTFCYNCSGEKEQELLKVVRVATEGSIYKV